MLFSRYFQSNFAFCMIVIKTFGITQLSQENYLSRGFQSFSFDFTNEAKLTQGDYTLDINLESNKVPVFLAYCYAETESKVKSIMYDTVEIENYIGSDRHECEFDNNAALFHSYRQSISLTSKKLSIEFKKFSVYELTNLQFKLYVYSGQQTSYKISISIEDNTNCKNLCNGNGKCIDQLNFVPVCKCEIQYFDNMCLIDSFQIYPNNRISVSMQSMASQMFYIPILNTKNQQTQIQLESSENVTISYSCYMEQGYAPYNNNENQFNISQSNSTQLIFTGSYMDNCINVIDRILNETGIQLEPKILILFQNKQKNLISVSLSLQFQINNYDSLETLYIVLASIGGILFIFFSTSIFVIIKRRKYRANQNNQKGKNKNQLVLTGLQMLYQDIKTYAQLLCQYPGLHEMNECQICLQEINLDDQVSFTICLHLFHFTCLQQWYTRNKVLIQNMFLSCPFCREPVKLSTLYQWVDIEKQMEIDKKKNEIDEINEINELQKQRLSKLNILKQPTVPSLVQNAQGNMIQNLIKNNKSDEQKIQSLMNIDDNID